MAARFGPFQGLRAFQERVLGGDERTQPDLPRRTWGQREGQGADSSAVPDII